MTTDKPATKKITLDLTAINGNAFALLGAFSKQAKREGWHLEEISVVLEEARSSNYDHLVQTLLSHCE